MIPIGKFASCSTQVNDKNTAMAVASGSLDVFSTPMMIALMEQAACLCIKGNLEAGQTTVGMKVDVSHIKPSPIGTNITATATVTDVDNKFITFAVKAEDKDALIGMGVHVRVIVDIDKFMGKL